MGDGENIPRCDVCGFGTLMLFPVAVVRPRLADGKEGRVYNLCAACKANPKAEFVTS